jgi:diguanylate cyclase (GGDEF)-like protein/PAS domain S-box-containing protein
VQTALVQELRGSEERYRQLVEQLGEGLALLDAAWIFRLANPAMHRTFGVAEGELLGRRLESYLAPSELEGFAQRCGALRAGRGQRLELQILTPQRERRILQTAFSPSPEGSGFSFQARDVTDLHQARRDLERLAFQDGLTGLGNEESSRRHLAELLKRHPERSLAVLWLDLDDFRRVNHSFGRPAGDRLLRQVASQMRRWSKSGDWLARLGGDEFLLIRSGVDPLQAPVMAADLQAFLAGTVRSPEGDLLSLGFSGGLSLYPRDGGDAEALLLHAATALGQAHDRGAGVVLTYKPHFTDRLLEQLDLEKRLRQALEEGGLRLAYQPQFDCGGRMIGHEALLRWHDPELGPVSPARFIAVAERSGLIHALGRWVLDAACAQQRRWLDAGLAPPPVAVNASPRQFSDPPQAIPELVAELLARYRLPPGLLELEITETCILPISGIGPDLDRLAALGVGLAIDDFGTGYSSLTSLHRLPLHKLKIDQSFVASLVSSEAARLIVRTAVAMGRGLGMTVLVEGVETADQLALLQTMDCDGYQGYLFARPLEAEDFAARLCQETAMLSMQAAPLAAERQQ